MNPTNPKDLFINLLSKTNVYYKMSRLTKFLKPMSDNDEQIDI